MRVVFVTIHRHGYFLDYFSTKCHIHLCSKWFWGKQCLPWDTPLFTSLVRFKVQGEEYLLKNMRHPICEQLVEGTVTHTIFICFHDDHRCVFWRIKQHKIVDGWGRDNSTVLKRKANSKQAGLAEEASKRCIIQLNWNEMIQTKWRKSQRTTWMSGLWCQKIRAFATWLVCFSELSAYLRVWHLFSSWRIYWALPSAPAVRPPASPKSGKTSPSSDPAQETGVPDLGKQEPLRQFGQGLWLWGCVQGYCS